MTKEDALNYISEKKKRNVHHHQQVMSINSSCKGLTYKEFTKVAIHGKRRFRFKHTNNRYWRYYDVKLNLS